MKRLNGLESSSNGWESSKRKFSIANLSLKEDKMHSVLSVINFCSSIIFLLLAITYLAVSIAGVPQLGWAPGLYWKDALLFFVAAIWAFVVYKLFK